MPALLAVIGRIRRREFSREEGVIAAVVVGHAVLVAAQILVHDRYLFLSTRYLTPVAPLAFGWSALFGIRAWEELTRWRPQWFTPAVLRGILAFLVLAFTAAAAGPVIKEHTSKKKSALYRGNVELAGWIAADYRGPRYFEPELDPFEYFSRKLPQVVVPRRFVQTGYLAGGSSCRFARGGGDYVLLEKGEPAPAAAPGIWCGSSAATGTTISYGKNAPEPGAKEPIYERSPLPGPAAVVERSLYRRVRVGRVSVDLSPDGGLLHA